MHLSSLGFRSMLGRSRASHALMTGRDRGRQADRGPESRRPGPLRFLGYVEAGRKLVRPNPRAALADVTVRDVRKVGDAVRNDEAAVRLARVVLAARDLEL